MDITGTLRVFPEELLQYKYNLMKNGKRILVSGATGAVGEKLIDQLLRSGYEINALTRSPSLSHGASEKPGLRWFYWNIDTAYIDPQSVIGIHSIVHLSGENIGAKPWTKKRKKAIYNSRVTAMELIWDLIRKNPSDHDLQAVISASASGYYSPNQTGVMTEEAEQGTGFLGNICAAWEDVVQDEAEKMGIRPVSLRCGVILTKHTGLLHLMGQLFKYRIAAKLGSGRQFMPWVHLDDVVNAYHYSIENEDINGVYNVAAEQQITQSDFMNALSRHLDRKIWVPNIPAFLIRLALGEQSALVLDSMRLSSKKLRAAGFRFKFDKIDQAL